MTTTQGNLVDPVAVPLRIERASLKRLDAIVATNGLSRMETIRRMLDREIEIKERQNAKAGGRK